MRQIDLSDASGQELRNLLFASRKGGDMALQDAVLRELHARGARPHEPQSFAAPPPEPRQAYEPPSPGPAPAAATPTGFQAIEPAPAPAPAPRPDVQPPPSNDRPLAGLNPPAARPAEPQGFAAPSDNASGFEPRSPFAPAAAAAPGFEAHGPAPGGATPEPDVASRPHDPPLPFGRFRPEPAAQPAPAPYEGELRVAPVRPAPAAAQTRTQAQAPPPPARRSGKLALFGVLALTAAGAGVWLAQDGPGRRAPPAAATPPAPVVEPRADAALRPSSAQAALPLAPAEPPASRGLVVTRAAPAPAPVTSAAAARSVASDLPPPPPLPPLPPRQAVQATARPVQPPPLAASPQGGAVRVFVHVADDAQSPVVEQIRAQLGGLRFGGQPVAMPPVRFVPSTPRRAEVRCLQHADCAAAGQIAGQLSRSLGTQVAVVDMSRTYEQDRNVRPGSLELWLPTQAGRFR